MNQTAQTSLSSGKLAPARAGHSLDWSDDSVAGVDVSCYCPAELLGTFTLLMAGQGRIVSSAMMLGDREYALWQLARAHALADVQLRAVAVSLFAYFDDPRGWGSAGRA